MDISFRASKDDGMKFLAGFLSDMAVATGLALVFLLLSWSYGRVLSRGRPLNAFKKRLLGYGFLFALGMIYLMVFVSDLHWPRECLFPAIGLWGGTVGLLAWWRIRGGWRSLRG
jgi:hypothetical protein